jgi:DNA-binding ferritin-like protein (Dps family)|tara:strand:- start:2230 stop:2388 length:159 start_codon:yes stop_codon:yes gene_type:complete
MERERNEALKEMKDSIGFDISFSDDMVFQNALDTFTKEYTKELRESVLSWMR